MAEDKEWKRHMEAILVAFEKSTEPGKMSRKEALGFADLLIAELEARQEALEGEIEDDDEDVEGDEELLESAEEYLSG